MQVLNRLRNSSTLTYLMGLKRTPRYTLLSEPFFGMSYNLFSPYHTLFMLHMGLTNQELGYITSIFLFSQFIFAGIGGAIIDKFGRRRSLFVGELFIWITTLIVWAYAQNFWYFAIGVICNGVMGMGVTTWNCLLVEDLEPEKTLRVFGLVYLASAICAFITPLGGLMVGAWGLEEAMRIMYTLSATIMLCKAFFLYYNAAETQQGLRRMEASKGRSLFSMLKENGRVLLNILHTPRTIIAFFILLSFQIMNRVNVDFYGTIVGQRLGIPDALVPIFPFVKSMVMLCITLAAVPRVNMGDFRKPLFLCILCMALDQGILMLPPIAPLAQLTCAVLLEGVGMALLQPIIDSLTSLNVNPGERAQTLSVMRCFIYLTMVPFGSFAGFLSARNTAFPFLMNIVFLCLIVLLALFLRRFMTEEHAWAES